MAAADQVNRMLRIGVEPGTRIERPRARRRPRSAHALPRARGSARSAAAARACTFDQQRIAVAQRPAMQRAESGVDVARAAAEHDRHLEAASHRQVRARAVPRAAAVEHVARSDRLAAPAGDGLRSDVCGELGTGERDDRVGAEMQARADHTDLQHCGVLAVADQCIGEAEGDVVHRPCATDAERGETAAAAILQRAQHAGLEHANAHGECGRASAANAAASIGRKRTRSPGASRHGDSLPASNRASGVRPINCQPPGRSAG